MWLLRKEMSKMSLWLIMSEQREKHKEERQMLIYAMTLGKSDLSAGILANNSQLG